MLAAPAKKRYIFHWRKVSAPGKIEGTKKRNGRKRKDGKGAGVEERGTTSQAAIENAWKLRRGTK